MVWCVIILQVINRLGFALISFNLFNLAKHKFSKAEQKVIFLAALGGGLEFFDFAIFGLYAIYFAPEVFPASSHSSSIAYVYLVFALSFLLKPVGVYLAHHIAIRSNPKRVLIFTILIIGLSSMAIGLVPPYASIGAWAGFLMIFFRFIQGIAAGAEAQGMIKYLNQNISSSKAPFSISGILLGCELGGFIALLLNQILAHSMSHVQIVAWGWRIPFIIGGVLAILCYIFRYKFKTTRHPYASDKYYQFHLFIILRNYLPQVLVLASTAGLISSLWINCIVYMPVLLFHHLGLSYRTISSLLVYATIYSIFASYITALIAKKIKPLKLFKFCLVIAIPAVIFSYYNLSAKTHINYSVNILIICHGVISRLAPLVFIDKLFPPQVRLAGVTISVNTGYIIFGVFSPLIIILIMTLTNTLFLAEASYIIFAILMSMIGLHVFEKVQEPSL